MAQKKNSNDTKFSFNDISQKYNAGLQGLDKERLRGLQGLNRFRTAKKAGLAREKERLTAKLGPNDPRVLRLRDKETNNLRLTRDLVTEIDRAGTDLSGYDKNAWNLYGCVRDRDSKPVPNLTAALYDKKGRWLRQLGYGCTDKQGKFSIIYPREGEEGKLISETSELFLHITDMNQKVLYKATDPLFFRVGHLDYREINLSGDEGVCSTPEPGKEDSPLPPRQWVVKGWVNGENGEPMAGVAVSLYDKDLLFDDYLGTRNTDENGNFEFVYQEEGFKGLLEKKPDIYLKVLDKTGKPIFTSKKAVKCEAGRIEVFNIKIEDLGKTKREFPIPPEVKKEKGK